MTELPPRGPRTPLSGLHSTWLEVHGTGASARPAHEPDRLWIWAGRIQFSDGRVPTGTLYLSGDASDMLARAGGGDARRTAATTGLGVLVLEELPLGRTVLRVGNAGLSLDLASLEAGPLEVRGEVLARYELLQGDASGAAGPTGLSGRIEVGVESGYRADDTPHGGLWHVFGSVRLLPD